MCYNNPEEAGIDRICTKGKRDEGGVADVFEVFPF